MWVILYIYGNRLMGFWGRGGGDGLPSGPTMRNPVVMKISIYFWTVMFKILSPKNGIFAWIFVCHSEFLIFSTILLASLWQTCGNLSHLTTNRYTSISVVRYKFSLVIILLVHNKTLISTFCKDTRRSLKLKLFLIYLINYIANGKVKQNSIFHYKCGKAVIAKSSDKCLPEPRRSRRRGLTVGTSCNDGSARVLNDYF